MDIEDNDPLNLNAVDRQIRLNRRGCGWEDFGGESRAGTRSEPSDELDTRDDFLERLLASESAEWTTHFSILRRRDYNFMPPDELDEGSLSRELWRLIEALADIRVFLCNTNHLSNRELYVYLWNEGLREQVIDLTHDEEGAWHLDPLGRGTGIDTYLSFKYYADEEWRTQWLEDFPDYDMPPHEDPPYDRDQWLPRRSFPGGF